ncbi:response regulator transcription factor [Streptomyces sp. SID3343]|uniref:response regulator transcription factor n=1 Tax=Streptomyces sp. SID3343 TaxID=2690260 RepID=UPI0013683F33|nr:response regulator transcription factor [Streptomyces sp. SID3343]MYW01874.1 response regulator [Streptomyces sp. SID3343]
MRGGNHGGAGRSRAGADLLLVVEDEPTVRELLSASLRFSGFAVESAATGDEALAIAGRDRPDLVVLDVMLPDMDGFEVLRRLREQRGGAAVPVLFLTARDDTADKLNGFLVGGDDYVTKPFQLDELIARIRAILRRVRGESAAEGTLSVADLEIDVTAHLVTRAGRTIDLSPTEFKLLRYLLEHVDQALDKSRILNDVWRYDFGGDAGIVESYISCLRRKVDHVEPKLIHTVRGIGYVLRRPRP